jgi:hypothetical protein
MTISFSSSHSDRLVHCHCCLIDCVFGAACQQDVDWIDIDRADRHNQLACSEYVDQIMDCLFQAEVR